MPSNLRFRRRAARRGFMVVMLLAATTAYAQPLYVNRTACTNPNVPAPQIVEILYDTTGPVPCSVRYTKAGVSTNKGAANVNAGICEDVGRRILRNLLIGGFSCSASLAAVPADADFSLSIDLVQQPPARLSDLNGFAVLVDTASDEDQAHVKAAGARRRFPNVQVRVLPPIAGRTNWSVVLAAYVSEATAKTAMATAQRRKLGEAIELLDLRRIAGGGGWTPVGDDWPRYVVAACFNEGRRTAQSMAQCSGLAVDQATFESCYRGGRCVPQRLFGSLRPPNPSEILSLKTWGQFLPPFYPSQSVLRDCFSSSRGERQAFGRCVVETSMTADQKRLYKCYQQSPELAELSLCAAGVNVSSADQRMAKCLFDAYGREEDVSSCLTQQVADPRMRAAIQCVQNGRSNSETSTCLVGAMGGNTQAAAQAQCVARHSGDRTATAVCVGASFLPPKQRTLAECAVTSDGFVSYGVCVAADDDRITPEQKIVLECLASTGGEPYSFAACTGGRLTVRELQKCLSGNIGGKDGCFGENNTIVVGLRNIWTDVSTLSLGPNNDIVRALRTIENDIRNGPGPNNDAVKVLNNAWNDVTKGPGDNNEFVKAGRAIAKAFGF